MKKSYNSADIHQKQGQEQSKKLYRSISEQSKRLDDARSCARTIGDLFTPVLQIQRRKLCEYCERLIFSEPLLYGRKGEELLWRKCFYDVVSTAKRLKKKDFLPEEISNLVTHINAGIGFYHHFISKLQNEYNLCLKNIVDFAITCNLDDKKAQDLSAELSDYVTHSIHQCLIYLGDLSRYKLEIYPNWEATLSVRYYLQAISYKPEYGMPHNQMGTLAMTQNRHLDAVYYYMRCLACRVSFEGTTNNLQSLFEKNSKYIEELPEEKENILQSEKPDITKCFIARFLLLIDIWYFNKNIPTVYSLCHQTYKNLEECLSLMRPSSSESGDCPIGSESGETDSSSSPTFLNNAMLFKIVVICLLCITKLQNQNSQQLSAIVAFTLAVYSQLIQHVANHIRESVLNYPLPESVVRKNKIQRKKSKLRRRKVVQVDSEESDISDNDENVDSESSSDDSFISDVEDILAESSDDDTELSKNSLENSRENCTVANTANDTNDRVSPASNKTLGDDEKTLTNIINKVKRMDVNDMLEIISEEGALASIKILNDWLINDSEVLKTCGLNTRSLFRQITSLLNLLNVNIKSSKVKNITINVNEVLENEAKIPLPEDISLKGMEILKNVQNKFDWSYIHSHNLNAKDENIIRIAKFLSFGKALTGVEEVGMSFVKKVFTCESKDNEEDTQLPNIITELENQESENIKANRHDKESSSRGMMKMKHMGQLWLAAEVRSLENRVRGKTSLSPYLVLDADALIKYTFMVKHLVHSRKFIVLVPSAVVSALDDLKREKLEARDAIRWLEAQFHRGNRFFRAQRPQERASIPFIKYPKKKDKEMFIYIQIIECCYYLAQQQKDASNLVTLLIGNQNVLINGENKEFSYVGLAKSAGVSIESITQFYGKWKKSSKGKR